MQHIRIDERWKRSSATAEAVENAPLSSASFARCARAWFSHIPPCGSVQPPYPPPCTGVFKIRVCCVLFLPLRLSAVSVRNSIAPRRYDDCYFKGCIRWCRFKEQRYVIFESSGITGMIVTTMNPRIVQRFSCIIIFFFLFKLKNQRTKTNKAFQIIWSERLFITWALLNQSLYNWHWNFCLLRSKENKACELSLTKKKGLLSTDELKKKKLFKQLQR